ncbi:hypothetical protein NTD84_03400 [Pseudomonas sp. 14P_8.1_Bac3]|uniref:hypothetical protein n=1 Tax=Pseudomonas sp. 14P_8.1_Bac3 TaxID=2971621 RepID=UPI0021C66DB1|nr:hypothetical protein [Pseudomonas sp. 14P_8.1_Bac3]MCU1758767.1 hypothetical protein [Pseudomonas sp. 14P_8.1_Bac3]
MSEKPITPGPWGVHRRMKDCVTFSGRHGEENLFLKNIDGYFACQSPADARLISAAPEMLAALQAARDLWGDYLPPGNSNAMKAMKLVDAAIAKATQ